MAKNYMNGYASSWPSEKCKFRQLEHAPYTHYPGKNGKLDNIKHCWGSGRGGATYLDGSIHSEVQAGHTEWMNFMQGSWSTIPPPGKQSEETHGPMKMCEDVHPRKAGGSRALAEILVFSVDGRCVLWNLCSNRNSFFKNSIDRNNIRKCERSSTRMFM